MKFAFLATWSLRRVCVCVPNSGGGSSGAPFKMPELHLARAFLVCISYIPSTQGLMVISTHTYYYSSSSISNPREPDSVQVTQLTQYHPSTAPSIPALAARNKLATPSMTFPIDILTLPGPRYRSLSRSTITTIAASLYTPRSAPQRTTRPPPVLFWH